MALYAADGSLNVTVVDGTTYVGRYASNGSMNVVVTDGSTLTGIHHPSGALHVVLRATPTTSIQAPSGGVYVSESGSYQSGSMKVTVVSGSLGGGGGLTTPTLTWVSATNDPTPAFNAAVAIGIMAENDDWIIEIDDNASFSSPTQITGTVNATDAGDGQIDQDSGVVLQDGTQYARFRVLRSATPVTNWSNTASQAINAPPSMTSSAAFSIVENTTAVGTLTANQTSTFALGGVDAAFFQITGGNQLSFISAPNFEAPGDAGGNNVYNITITPTATADSEAGSAQSVAVTVTNDAADDFTNPTSVPNLGLWIDASDLSTLFQEMAGTTAVTTNGQNIGKANDKSGNAFHLTARADDATRPTYGTSGGLHWINILSQTLRRDAALNLGSSAGGYSIFLALRSVAGSSNRYLITEGNSVSNNHVWSAVKSDNVTASSASMDLRNDSGTSLSNNVIDTANVFNGTDKVFALIDDGAGNVNTYVNGTLVTTSSYTRSGTMTAADRFAVSGLLRTSFLVNSEFNGDTRLYQIAIYKRAVNASERAAITTYVGAKAGLTV